MKKYLIVFVCIFTALLLASCNINTDNTPEANPSTDFICELAEDGQSVYISKYIGTSTHVVIPEEIDGLPVISLKGTFENGHIVSGVFENSDIETVVMPDSIVAVGMRTFKDCKNLTEVAFSSKCNRVIDWAFENCVKLETLDLSGTEITLINNYAFAGCTNLSKIEFPDSVSKIGMEAFRDCSSLLELKLPKELSEIDKRAFYNCTSLKSVTIPNRLFMLSRDEYRFYNTPALEKIIIDDGREALHGYAFFHTTTDVEIIFPKSIKRVGNYSFSAHGPTKYVFLGDCPENLEDIVFLGEPATVCYDPSTNGWDGLVLKNGVELIPIE